MVRGLARSGLAWLAAAAICFAVTAASGEEEAEPDAIHSSNEQYGHRHLSQTGLEWYPQYYMTPGGSGQQQKRGGVGPSSLRIMKKARYLGDNLRIMKKGRNNFYDLRVMRKKQQGAPAVAIRSPFDSLRIMKKDAEETENYLQHEPMTASEFLRALLADRASSRPASANDGSGGGGGGDARIRVRRQDSEEEALGTDRGYFLPNYYFSRPQGRSRSWISSSDLRIL